MNDPSINLCFLRKLMPIYVLSKPFVIICVHELNPCVDSFIIHFFSHFFALHRNLLYFCNRMGDYPIVALSAMTYYHRSVMLFLAR